VIAPDMRGYNLSDKPRGVAAYRTEVLARDVARLIDACGATRASVVGHDWGAGVAWSFATQYPELLERLVILNVPHPITMRRGLQGFGQLRKSCTSFSFKSPGCPSARAADPLRLRAHRAAAGPDAQRCYSARDIEEYVAAIARPGALTATINYTARCSLRAAGDAHATAYRCPSAGHLG